MEELDHHFLPGVYELVKVIAEVNGAWVDQQARSGLFTFTPQGKLSVVNSPNSAEVISYAGTYQVKGHTLEIQIAISNLPELEGKLSTRKILFLDPECLILEAIGARSGLRTRLTWKKIAYLQPA